VDLPKELPDTPYVAAAFRISHFHIDEEDDPSYPGTLVLELAGKLPGTEADIHVPFEISHGMAIEIVEDLIAQYRCMTYGERDYSDEGDDQE
jgi:hypothetical protein